MGEGENFNFQAMYEEVLLVPTEVQADWEMYVTEVEVHGVWARALLTPEDRSLITIAALTAVNCQALLRSHIRMAMSNGISRRRLCEVMLQVAGYAGRGPALDGMLALQEVFGSGSVPPVDESADEPAGATVGSPDRLAKGLEVLSRLRPGQDPLAVRYPFAPDWRPWLVSTAFGDLWSRPGLSLIERERVTISVLVALGRDQELRDHLGIARTLGIPTEEIGEQLMHLATYVGFPRVVASLRIASDVLAE